MRLRLLLHMRLLRLLPLRLLCLLLSFALRLRPRPRQQGDGTRAGKELVTLVQHLQALCCCGQQLAPQAAGPSCLL